MKNVCLCDGNLQFCFISDGILVFIMHIKPTMCTDDTNIKNLIFCSVNNKGRHGILVFIIHIKPTMCTDDTNIKNLISTSVNNKGLVVFNYDIGIIHPPLLQIWK
ncbi:hypothetical protein C0J52_26530 [Blattella germanica]|nr:hypothetical protein C0J52_26530 [Blattella germanica]